MDEYNRRLRKRYTVNIHVKHTFNSDTRDNYMQIIFIWLQAIYSEHFSSEYMYSKLNFTCSNNTITLIVSVSFHINLCIHMLFLPNAAYIAAIQCACYSLLLNHLQNKNSPFCHLRISTGTVYATNLVANSYI